MIACGALLVVLIIFMAVYLGKYNFVYTTYPTESAEHRLSIALYTGFQSNEPIITLGHYVDGQHICNYALTITNGIGEQEPQRYNLPELTEGTVTVQLELGGAATDSIVVTYDDAGQLYENGLLIYLTNNDSESNNIDGEIYRDEYVYFISGAENICHFKDAFATDWSVIANAPKLKKMPKVYNDGAPFLPWASGWEENKWVVIPAN